MRLDYDLDARALYVTITNGPVARTVPVDDSTNVDVDAGGQLVGVEVLDYGRPWPLEQILSRWRVSESHAGCLRAVLAAGLRAPEMSVVA